MTDKAKNMHALWQILIWSSFGRFLGPIFGFSSFYSWVNHWVFYEKRTADNGREESEIQLHIYFLCCDSNSLYIFWGKVGGKNWKGAMIVVRSYWYDCTSPKIKSMGGFFNFNFCNEMSFSCQIYWSAPAGLEISPGYSIAGNWSRYNFCDIVITASVAFWASTDPGVHFKCCISVDAKIQASIKHGTEVKPIHRKPWFHSIRRQKACRNTVWRKLAWPRCGTHSRRSAYCLFLAFL